MSRLSKVFSLKTIKGKFIITVIFASLGLFLIFASFFYSRVESEHATVIIDAVKDGQVDLLTLRRHEKDFMARKDLKYDKKFDDSYEHMTKDHLPLIAKVSSLKKSTESLLEELKRYRELFKSLVKEYETIGLNETSGLKGALRASIHKVEEEGKRLNVPELSRDMLQLRRNEKDFLLRMDTKYIDKFSKNCDQINQTIDKQKIPAQEKETIKQLVQDYKTKFLQLTEGYKRIGLTHNDGIRKEMRQLSAAIEPHFETFRDEVLNSMQKRLDLFAYITYGAVGFLFITFIILIRFVFRSVLRPVDSLKVEIHRLATDTKGGEGDLTRVLDVRREDEIGLLTSDYNFLIGEFNNAFCTFKDSVKDLAHAADEIEAGGHDLATRTNEQAASVTETSATIDDLKSTIVSSTENVGTITDELDRFNAEVHGKSGHIKEVTDTMSAIDESGKRIDNIVNVINDISFQTNLLALNAAVEAARAGEAGRGFAVVAAEVRNLAQKTAESSKNIQEIVTQNVESTQKGITLVQETAHFFTVISEKIQHILDRLKENSERLHSQTNGIEQIALAMSQLETVINRNAALSEEFSAASGSIKSNSMDLQNAVSQFKTTGETAAPVKKQSSPLPTKAKLDKPQPAASKPKKKEELQPIAAKKAETDDFFAAESGDEFEEF